MIQMSTIKVNNISNVAGTKAETSDNIIDKKFGTQTIDSTRATYSKDTPYQASTDLILTVSSWASDYGSIDILSDNSNPLTREIAFSGGDKDAYNAFFVTVPIRKGNWWKVRDNSGRMNAGYIITTTPW